MAHVYAKARRGAPADEHAATELVMYIENESDLSPDGPSGQGRSVLLNMLRKWKKGTYDSTLAVKQFEYLAEAGAKRYAKEFGSSPKEWSTMFTPATRHEAAKQLEASFRNSAEHGEYDHVDTRTGQHSRDSKVAAPRMDKFTRAYFETALWSSTDNSRDDGGDPLDANYSIDDIAPETRAKMIADCTDFQERYADLLTAAENIDSEQAGHNFWLSRNGHGAGFFDDDLDELQEAAKSYGEFDLYIGDDGQIHGTPLESRRGMRAPRVVRDFNTLDDLIDHAARDLGATHVTGAGPTTKLYFPRGGTHPYEEAKVWRKGSYWHAEGPGARTGVKHLPKDAQELGGRGARRAAEVDARKGEARKYWVVEQVQNGHWSQIGHFHEKGAALRFAATVPGKKRVIHTWPSSHDYPIEGGVHGTHKPREARNPRRSAHKPLR